MRFDLPPVVASKARVAGRRDWLDQLPALVEALAAEWRLSIGPVLPGGTEALVLDVETHDGEAAVLKLVVPRTGAARNEITVLRLAAGVVERVSTGLLAIEIGLRPEGDEMLEAAEVIARHHRTG